MAVFFLYFILKIVNFLIWRWIGLNYSWEEETLRDAHGKVGGRCAVHWLLSPCGHNTTTTGRRRRRNLTWEAAFSSSRWRPLFHIQMWTRTWIYKKYIYINLQRWFIKHAATTRGTGVETPLLLLHEKSCSARFNMFSGLGEEKKKKKKKRRSLVVHLFFISNRTCVFVFLNLYTYRRRSDGTRRAEGCDCAYMVILALLQPRCNSDHS